MNSSLMLSKWGRQLGKQWTKVKGKPKPTVETTRWNIVRGDLVQVIQGPQTGQQGKILEVIRKSNRVIIDGVNLRSRNIRPKGDGNPGKKVVRACTVHYSNVMLVDPTTGEPTKVNRKFLEDGTKVRVSKKTGQVIEKPAALFDRLPRSVVTGPKDTRPLEVFAVTFQDYAKYLPYIYATEK